MSRRRLAGLCGLAGFALGVTATAYDGQWLLGAGLLGLGIVVLWWERVRHP